MPRILVVDDEQDLCEILRFNLEAEGYEVLTAGSAEEALPIIKSGMKLDLLMLDVMMDAMSGFDFARRLRAEGFEVPIIFLTALATDDSQVEGFAAGADDYIYKPFSFATVKARVAAVLKRTSPSQQQRPAVEIGHLLIVPAESSAYIDGSRLQLTKKEYGILYLLAANRGAHLSREQIMASVWGNEVCVGDRSVDVHIARLRRKMGAAGALIVNHSGLGYCIE